MLKMENLIIDDETILKNLRLKLAALNIELSKITDKIQKIQTAIDAYSIDNVDEKAIDKPVEITTETYNPNAEWRDKIIYALKTTLRAMTTREIVDFILSKEPGQNPTRVFNAVSGVVFQLKKSGFLKPYVPFKMKGHYHANSNWFDNNGKLLPQYEPQVTSSLW